VLEGPLTTGKRRGSYMKEEIGTEPRPASRNLGSEFLNSGALSNGKLAIE
jgi:hypothetical protein